MADILGYPRTERTNKPGTKQRFGEWLTSRDALGYPRTERTNKPGTWQRFGEWLTSWDVLKQKGGKYMCKRWTSQ